jgi:broad specificity phosphatase PhoE
MTCYTGGLNTSIKVLARPNEDEVIYLVRHGETVWNLAGRFQGQHNSPLTTLGIKQADRIGMCLAKEIADLEARIEGHVSPLGRAKETAARIANFVPLTFRDEPRLMEVTLGSWDGMTHYEIDFEYPGALVGSDAFDWYFRSPDGETFDQACERVTSWLSSVTSPTVAISHGLTSRLIRGIYLGLTRREMLELPVPQSSFVVLTGGQSHYIE